MNRSRSPSVPAYGHVSKRPLNYAAWTSVGGDQFQGRRSGDPANWVICDTGEDVAELGFRVDAVELGGADQRVDGGGN